MRVRVLAMGVSVREEGARHARMTNPATPVVLGEAAGPVLSWLLATYATRQRSTRDHTSEQPLQDDKHKK